MKNASYFKPTAQRIVNGEEVFISNIMKIAGCSRSDAEKVLALYRKLKVVKTDAVGGVINIKHGVFYEKDVIENAIKQKN